MDAAPALSCAHGISAVPLRGETIGANLRQTVLHHGDREALVVRHQDYRATYRELWDVTTAVARGLLALDVARGERVGVWAPNRWEWVAVQYATARVGAILVNINPAFQARELELALRQSGTSVLFLARGYRQTAYQSLLESVRASCPALRAVVRFDDDWDHFFRRGESVDPTELARREAELHSDDPINIQYTSGTTGYPKGATLTHHNLLNNAYFVGLLLGYSERDRVCIPVPFYHCFGMVLGNLACTSHGACMVVPGEAFAPSVVLATIGAERCTSLYGVPTMFHALLEHPDFARADCSSLRTGIMAGAPCPIELMRRVVTQLHVPQVAIGYGMTETSPISTMTALDDPLERRVGSVGRAIPHVEICVRAPGGGPVLPRGVAGEFCARGYHVMRGYWDDPAATAEAIDAAGWMRSGDLAVMDEAGYVRITGRLKDLIIRGGENIAPREVEAVLEAHPTVGEVQVVGVPSAKYGEEMVAFVKPRAGATATEGELAAWCRAHLAAFKVPRWWRFTDAFPLTVTGKVQKFKLREQAVAELGRQADAQIETA